MSAPLLRGASTAADIAEALDGRRSGDGWSALCPAHSDHKRSLSISERNGKVLVFCHAGCEQSEVIEELRALGLWPIPRGARRHEARKMAEAESAAPRRRERRGEAAASKDDGNTAAALRIWLQTEPAVKTPVEKYLRSRRIKIATMPEKLRYHGGLWYDKFQILPAMVAAVQNVRDDVTAIHRTFLRPDGSAKADVDPAKKMLGPTKGGAVRLTEAGETLAIAEGIETALSVHVAAQLPTWAALSANGIAGLELPALPLARDVIIAVDADDSGVGTAAAQKAASRWIAEGRRVRIAAPPPGMDFNDVLRKHGAARVRKLIKAAVEPPQEAASPPARAVIRVTAEDHNAAIREAADVVRNRVYMRDTAMMLLRSVARTDGHAIGAGDSAVVEINGVQYPTGSMALMDATPPRVQYELDDRVLFEKFSVRDGWVTTHCPKDIAAQLVANATEMRFRTCAGIVHVPLLFNGSLVTESGWHEPTGLILDVTPLPPLPLHPTRADTERALRRLRHPFRGFRGVVDDCALVTAALTAVVRPSLPTAPAICADGNGPGVGKGLLCRALAMLATGGRPATITEGHNAEEMEKRITAGLLSGVPALLLDNLQRPLASSALESAITEGVATIRIFGALTNLNVACRALILITANNAKIRRDMLRRTLPVRIVVPSEAPERRKFDFDPIAEVRRDRPKLLAAAFTVLLAWARVRHLRGNDVHRRVLGSFEEWSELVAGAVSWLTGKNPIEIIEERKIADDSGSAERAVIEALVAEYGTRAWKAADAVLKFRSGFWEAAIPDQKFGIDGRAVGNWLRARKDQVFNNWILTGTPDRKGVVVWRLKPTAGSAGCAGSLLPRRRKVSPQHPPEHSRKRGGLDPATPGRPGTPRTHCGRRPSRTRVSAKRKRRKRE
jgi:phage/plasmid primase-like uncharacterized protein